MRLTPFDPERDFEKIKDWSTDERSHGMWCGGNFAFPLERENFLEGLSGFVRRYGDVPLLAVTDRGEPVGFFTYALDSETKECLLKLVIVKPECRGKGVGREMLALAAERIFSETDAALIHLNVFLENVGAKRCYEHAGFTDRTVVPDAFPWRDERWGKCNMIMKRPGRDPGRRGEKAVKKILIALPTEENEREAFRRAAAAAGGECEVTFTTPGEATEEQIREACFILGNVPAKKLAGAENLDVLQLFSAGADAYLKKGVLPERTVLCNATGAYGQAVGEHAFALTMMLIKKLHLYRSSQLRSRWEDHGGVTSLAGATVLVAGLGDIGLYYARLVKAMGARVIGVKRRSGPCPEGVDELVLTADFDRVLPEADVVMSVLPSTEDTVHFYTAERFRRMKDTAVFVNCGRGDAVAHDVLLQALRTGEIAAAAVDVCETEPLPADSPLWAEEKLVITPHVAGNFHHPSIYAGVMDIALENIENYLSGRPLRNTVDPQTGYKR
jgi:phosphoglycerate dehydrogenase-like enzyme/RimJ/RimL family protein N-acetyltransferase